MPLGRAAPRVFKQHHRQYQTSSPENRPLPAPRQHHQWHSAKSRAKRHSHGFGLRHTKPAAQKTSRYQHALVLFDVMTWLHGVLMIWSHPPHHLAAGRHS